MNRNKRKIAVDLFSGVGGMTLGFEMAGFDVLASVDIDPIHCITHRYNFPFWTVLCQSITEITGDYIRNNSEIQGQEIDLVFGGPPCQGFSLIGKRCLTDPRNNLLAHFVRLVLELQPKYFVMENVKGIAVGKHQEILQEIIEKLSYNGYQVEENYQILNAANYGIPQNRERLFLLGSRQGYPIPKYPQPTTDPQGKNNLSQTPTVLVALQDLPEVNSYPELLTRDWVVADYGKASEYALKLRGIKTFDPDYSYPRLFDRSLLTSSMATEHSLVSIERFKQTLPGTTEMVSRFYRLSPDGLCNTLRAGTPSNRGAFTAPRPIHHATPRCITIREAARLHSYPDWFRFHVTKWHGFRQIGNSVPPLLAKAVGQEIIKLFGDKPVKPERVYELLNDEYLRFHTSDAAHFFGIDSKILGTRNRRK